MIRFIDLSEYYDPHAPSRPACAFLDTTTNRFVRAEDNTQIFHSMDDVCNCGERFVKLVPEGFFDVSVPKEKQ